MINKSLHGAYILAGFAVQRERIEGLAVFSKIVVGCFSWLFILYLTWRVMQIKTLEQVDAMTNWKY